MDNKIKIQNIYYLLSYAWDCIEFGEDQEIGSDTFDNIENLFAKLLIVSCRPLLKRGLSREYIEDLSEVIGIKGKLDLAATQKSGRFIIGKTVCNTDSFSYDIPLNQMIKAAILTILNCSNLTKENTKELHFLLRSFGGVTEKKLTSDLFRNIKVNSLNRNYSILIEIGKLILQNTTISSTNGSSQIKNFLDSSLDMAALFEKFLRNFYARELGPTNVFAERLRWEIDTSSDNFFKERIPSLLTDITIKNGEKVVVIDAKFYQEAMVTNKGNRFRYRRDHISQIMEYLRTSKRKYLLNAYGILLYPTVNYDINDFGIVEGLPVRVATIDLSKPWLEIKNKLLDVYDCAQKYHVLSEQIAA